MGHGEESRMKHKEPIMGSLHTPYRESGMRGFDPLPVVGFLRLGKRKIYHTGD